MYGPLIAQAQAEAASGGSDDGGLTG
jgi:hypothetical protein